MDTPRSILLIRPSALGDVCRSVPVLASLRASFPEASIDWFVHEAFADAVRHHPDLRAVVPFPRGRLGKRWVWSSRGRALFREVLGSLRTPKYDLVVDAQGLGRSGFFSAVTGAPRRVGFADARELGWLGYSERVRVPSGVRHSVARMLALLDGAGIEPVPDMRLHTSIEDRARAHELVGAQRYAVVAPTSRWAGKRWAEKRFIRVVQALLGEVERVVIVAAPSEREQCPELFAAAQRDERLVDLVGRTSIGELMAVIERASLVLANDSAPLHMAVGFDRPLVALFGPTRIDEVGPYRRDDDVLQACEPNPGVSHKHDDTGRALMDRISVEDVIGACSARLRNTSGAPS